MFLCLTVYYPPLYVSELNSHGLKVGLRWLSTCTNRTIHVMYEPFFLFVLFGDALTYLVLSHLGSLGCIPGDCVFLLYNRCALFKFYDLWMWWIMVKWFVVIKIQPSIFLDDWGKPQKNQSGWSAPGFEPGTSRMRVSCVTTETTRSVTAFTQLCLLI